MKDNTKNRLIVVALVAVCALLLVGIGAVLYKEPDSSLTQNDKEKGTDIVIDAETIAETEELIIESEIATTVDNDTQKIQSDAEKTEDGKPEEPPTLSEDSDTSNPDKEPSYEDGAGNNGGTPENNNPSHGDTKDGMIYIDGFGWVPDNGGGGSGSSADDMYENGNKVGTME